LDSGSAQGLAEREALMATNHVTVSKRDLMKNATVTITVKEDVRFKMRTAIGLRLIRLGARVMGFGRVLVETAKPAAEKR
jgi:hypothetical protein